MILRKVVDVIRNNLVVTFLSVALFAFVVSTIALAVENSDKRDEIIALRAELNNRPEDTTTTSAQEYTTTSVEVPTTTPSMETSPATTTTLAPTTTEAPAVDYRLPTHNIPKHYDLWLYPKLDEGTFEGKVEIEVETVEATSQIVLHRYLLDITDVKINPIDQVVGYNGVTYDDEKDFMIINTLNPLQAGKTTKVTIEFKGQMDNKIVGLYSSSYLNEETNDRIKIATSKFEPTFARQAFPCFDEPQLKATYTISLVHPSGSGYEALSNMDVAQTLSNTPSAGLSTTVFNRSVPMSTYLVVFIVSDFKYQASRITPNIGSAFDLRVYATPFQLKNVQFALETAKGVIEHYIDYFQIPYPLPKLDMAAIPDFVSGAMETWGLVTYRETSLLYDVETSSTANKQRVAEVIAHELAHMWFGNLVTMKWWNELWLNEGFASYIEYKGVDSVYPQWGIMEQFALDNLHGVLSLDATLGSHPIVVKVESPNQITEIFDTITYSKGASVIRMLEDFVSEPIFKQGVTAYLNKLQYSNGVSDDLMVELDRLFTDSEGATVATVMDTFTKQKGFPVINVERVGNQFHLTQQRFLADPDAKDPETSQFDYKWYVPLTYITSSDINTVQRRWFPHSSSKVYIDLPTGTGSWIKFNRNQVGYYRVNYPADVWVQFGDALVANVDTFTIGDRTGLLNDVFALADASMLKYDLALEMTRYLAQEQEYVPWATVASKMKSIRNLVYDYQSYDDITTYVRQLVQTAYNVVGWEVPEDTTGSNHMKNRLRTTILDLACSFGHEDCLTQAKTLFTAWLNTNAEVHPDLRTVVYYYGVQGLDSVSDWEKVKERFRAENDANEKAKLMSALAAFRDAKVLRRFLEEAWDPTLVREQDHLTCIQNVAANRAFGEQVAWDHVRSNWDRLVARYTLGERNLGRMIPSVTGRFSTRVRLMELEDFFARNPEAGAGATARVQALENISNNMKWLERNQQAVADWLKTAVQASARR